MRIPKNARACSLLIILAIATVPAAGNFPALASAIRDSVVSIGVIDYRTSRVSNRTLPPEGMRGDRNDLIEEDTFSPDFDAGSPPVIGESNSLSISGPTGTTTIRIHRVLPASIQAVDSSGGRIGRIVSPAASPLASILRFDEKENRHVLLDRRTGEVLEVFLPAR